MSGRGSTDRAGGPHPGKSEKRLYQTTAHSIIAGHEKTGWSIGRVRGNQAASKSDDRSGAAGDAGLSSYRAGPEIGDGIVPIGFIARRPEKPS